MIGRQITPDGIRLSIMNCEGVVACKVTIPSPGKVFIECTVNELTHAKVKEIDAVIRKLLPAGLDWQLDCVPRDTRDPYGFSSRT